MKFKSKIEIVEGNIFTSKAQTIVNTVNCVGVMGKGIAYEFRLRYPDMFEQYKDLCKKNLLQIGKLWLYKSERRWILNFPTKLHWRYGTKVEYLEKGLMKFMDTYRKKGITSIAFPILGAQNGGLTECIALDVMNSYLKDCDIPIEIYRFNPLAQDELFEKIATTFNENSIDKLANNLNINTQTIVSIKDALNNQQITSTYSLVNFGLSESTLIKLFKLL